MVKHWKTACMRISPWHSYKSHEVYRRSWKQGAAVCDEYVEKLYASGLLDKEGLEW